MRAITAVADGRGDLRPGVARRSPSSLAAAPATASAFPELTAREREILELLAAGPRNAQIAPALFLSPKTVRNNVSTIFTKLHVADRAAGDRPGPRGRPGTQQPVRWT